MTNELSNYLTFKACQYNRMQKNPLKGDDLKNWLKEQLINKTDLLKGWMKEAIEAGI